jgi:septum formation protein
MPASTPLILASSSPRRRDLLAEAGFRFEIITAEVEETLPRHLTVREAVLLNALRKGSTVAAMHPHAWVLAADTLVAVDGRPLGKPATLDEARQMLSTLSGRTHQVFSAVWIERREEENLIAFVEISQVRFRHLGEGEIDRYMDLVNVLDKAGAYAAQEDPIQLIAEIEGSRTNVIGLPMERVTAALAQCGILPDANRVPLVS